jgi:peptide/nickel transport system substrate-binding protein
VGGVRGACAGAIDRDAIIAGVYRGQARPATGLLPPGHWAYNGDVPTYPYDPAAARHLLDQAGFPDPEGPAPRFSLTYKTSQNQLTRRIGEVLQEQLAQVGIQVAVRSYEWGTFYADIKAGNFQLYTLSWVGVTDPDIYNYAFHSKSVPPDGANRGRYANPDLDALLERGRTEDDRDRRKAIYAEVQRIVARDLPYVSLWHPESVLVRDRRLTGFVLSPVGDYTSLAHARLAPG